MVWLIEWFSRRNSIFSGQIFCCCSVCTCYRKISIRLLSNLNPITITMVCSYYVSKWNRRVILSKLHLLWLSERKSVQPLYRFATVLFNLISILFRILDGNTRECSIEEHSVWFTTSIFPRCFFFSRIISVTQFKWKQALCECNIIKQTPHGVFL